MLRTPLLCLAAVLSLQATAPDPSQDPTQTPPQSQTLGKEDKAANGAPSPAPANGTQDPFFDFSVGLATMTLPKPEVVNAVIEDGVVRATEKRSFRAGPWFQAIWVPGWEKPGKIHYGIFVGVEASGEARLIKSVGLGGLLQFKMKPDKSALNLGVGMHWTSYQRLGDGFAENQAAPAGATAVRYRTETQPGVMISVSFGF